MRKPFFRTMLPGFLVMALLLSFTPGARALEVTESATEPASVAEITFPAEYTVDSETAIYQICDEMAQEMQARQILVYDTNTDRILYTKSVDSGKLYPASITKLFSAYVALQFITPDTVITVGDELELVHEGSSMAFIPEGSQLLAETVVEGMLMPSGNDAAMILATAAGRVIAEDESLPAADAVDVFVAEMNRQADILGFEKSHFANPDGWHHGSHYTCLNDLARISKLALENETISRYMKRYKDRVKLLSGEEAVWENNNLLLFPDLPYYRSDVVGMKTGYTRPSGYCLMSAFTFEEGEIVVGLFGYTAKYDRFVDAIRLADAVRAQLRLEHETIESLG